MTGCHNLLLDWVLDLELVEMLDCLLEEVLEVDLLGLVLANGLVDLSVLELVLGLVDLLAIV